jgi:zinc protease
VQPTTTPDAPFRAHKPDTLANQGTFHPPVPTKRTLTNGADLLVVENHALPLVAVDVVIRAGVDRDPLAKRGLCGLVGDMLLEGTRTKSALDLAIARERIAAQMTTSNDVEQTTIHLNALKETLPDALALLADVIENPAFRSEDLERRRALRLTYLESKKGDPQILANDVLYEALWGKKNPWGLPSAGTPATVKAIAVADLVRFHKAYYVPNNAVVSVSGDVTPDEAAAALDTALAGWKPGKVPPKATPPAPAASARAILLEDFPTGSQSHVEIGWRAPRASAPEMLPLTVANNVIGGLFSSRLNMNLREDKAYSYGVFSWFDRRHDASQFAAQGSMVAEHTADAVREMEKELAGLKTKPIGDDELARSKDQIVSDLPSLLETNDDVATAMARLVVLGMPLDYYATLPTRVNAVTRADVVAAIARYFDPGTWPIIVVGPKAKSEEALKGLGLGPVREVAP